MHNRILGKTAERVSVLGFGAMRLPIIDGDTGKIDVPEATRMLHFALDNGLNYLDTAYAYHNGTSEAFVGNALLNGYREKVHLATKLPCWLIQTRRDMDRLLNEQLDRLQTDRIDFYLLHALGRSNWDKLLDLGVLEFLDAAIADGRIRYAGFSYHDDAETFVKIVDAYDWGLCQIQYNYMDENYQAGRTGLRYASQKGLGIVVMEPLRGGKLASNIPADAVKALRSGHSSRMPVEWALRWLWNQPEIGTVLSGMSTMTQIQENIRLAANAEANCQSAGEIHIIRQVRDIFLQRTKVNCTACRYCQPCPSGVKIPECLSIYNNAHIYDDFTSEKFQYLLSLKEPERASHCTRCGQCESLCPQHIPIIDTLANVSDAFEKE